MNNPRGAVYILKYTNSKGKQQNKYDKDPEKLRNFAKRLNRKQIIGLFDPFRNRIELKPTNI